MARFIDIASGYPLELPGQPVTFGSAADNTIPIAEAFGLSARHFQITPTPGGNVLTDMTGQASTLVNDQPVTEAILRNGDVISAGRMKLRYESQPTPPPLPPEETLPVAAYTVATPPPAPFASGYGAPQGQENRVVYTPKVKSSGNNH